MERNSVSTRVKLALKRRELLSSVAEPPRRAFIPERDEPVFSYGSPLALTKSAAFVLDYSDTSLLRERFAMSRAILRNRLAKQFADDDDCGCEE